MLANIGLHGWIVILLIVLLLFGAKKLPQIGRAFGQTLVEFKSSTKKLHDTEIEEETAIEEKKA